MSPCCKIIIKNINKQVSCLSFLTVWVLCISKVALYVEKWTTDYSMLFTQFTIHHNSGFKKMFRFIIENQECGQKEEPESAWSKPCVVHFFIRTFKTNSEKRKKYVSCSSVSIRPPVLVICSGWCQNIFWGTDSALLYYQCKVPNPQMLTEGPAMTWRLMRRWTPKVIKWLKKRGSFVLYLPKPGPWSNSIPCVNVK